MILPVILAGGSGTRLWPLSRYQYPKQLLALSGDNSLLQRTALRLQGLEGAASPLVVCNEKHRFFVAEQFLQMEIDPFSIVLEPVGKNTAPAVAAAAIKALALGEDPVLFVLPADHHIQDAEGFLKSAKTGEALAEQGRLITFGVVPHAPETGYGYIRKGESFAEGAFILDKFVEKPDLPTAEQYLASGDYLWNSGMFMFKASVVLEELKKHAPEIVQACKQAVEGGREDLDFFRLDAKAFGQSPSISIDYAVMEKTSQGVVLPLEIGWDDLGSWESLWQTGEKDENSNVLVGDVTTVDVTNSYLHATKRMLAAVGVSDLVVVETADAILVANRDKVQNVKHIVEELRKRQREEAVSHRKVYRPWGSYESIEVSNRFQVKLITVKPGAKLSLQKHFHRAEHWVVVSGTAIASRDGEEITLHEDQSTYIPLGVVHRLENPGKIPLELIEVQSGAYLGEDDIVRLDDVYGR
ncbi:mannose-1-phosphate guanylyltransferase/mannose-6-phosphate isomerase [Desulfatibacillum aliphaticivorans]|uniref:mannose-1-phosphate guanylyltransferase n=1 Tax=Desulfatibacillum aliphaticivorans TaxID=218208 RepID=B8FA94_DESAL|nr:mannose-1-phosphate guanylyltransferase/mannose-6-phosphate isomerase [Desulfatibacillum aliphaticivorans]ACL03190.1 mannose-1-phosphate guanylyltransferase/mannose-6-phosphate isomerase [Desulfatibacillum aliphaticivorans]